jgi:inorganic pyrophosphatase
MELATVLPEGMTFPFDFGFVPSTLGEDGDPLDILVLMDAPVVPGCVIRANLLGAIEAKQRDGKGKWKRNDRLIGVASHAQTHQEARSLKDLRPHLIEEITAFFREYNQLRNRKFKPLEVCGPRKALKIVKTGMSAYAKARPGKAKAA